MWNGSSLRAVCVAALTVAASTAASAEDPVRRGLEIATKADAANNGFGAEKGVVTLELTNARGEVSVRKMSMEILEGTTDGDRSLLILEAPADVKGTKMLTWTHKRRDDDQWLFLPSIKRTKRISSSNRSGSFMASEFAYEDFSSQEIEKYTYKYIDEPTLSNRSTWRLERYPVYKDSGYSRQVLWMDKEYLAPVRIEYFDRKNELLKVAKFIGYERIAGFWRFKAIHVENVQTKKKSSIRWDSRAVRVKLSPQRFESAGLEG